MSTLFIKTVLFFAVVTNCQRYIFSFGDSYTTTGFNIAGELPSASNPIGNPPYPGITTDNGENYIDIFTTQQSGTLAYNFAVGGAQVNNTISSPTNPVIPDFITQRELFSNALVPQPSSAQWTSDNSIFTVFFGINDIVLTFPQGATPATSPYPAIFQTYATELQTLYNEGARRFVFLTVPPFNRAPVYRTLPTSVDAPLINVSILNWNSMLRNVASTFQSANNDSIVQILDTQPVFNRILNQPMKNGAPNNKCYNSDGVSCLWWDSLHPGQVIQKALGLEVYNTAKNMRFFG